MRLALKFLVAFALALPASIAQAPPALATTCSVPPPKELARRSDLVVVGQVVPDSVVEHRVLDKLGEPVLRIEALVRIDDIEKGWPIGGRRAPVPVFLETIRPEDDGLALGMCGPHLFENWASVRYYLKRPAEGSNRYRLHKATALKE
ncbi:MAG: hypothetical protein K0R83_308 [Caulobacter sp.]|jgi:hypothetical protein|nr:hypothetical protein [Caulobacter sp.]